MLIKVCKNIFIFVVRMKKIVVFAFLVLCLLPVVHAQRRSPILKNAIKFEMLNAVYGDYSFTYERLICPRTSLNFRVGKLNLYEFTRGNDYFTIFGKSNGFTSSFEYRYFINEKSGAKAEGFYAGAYVRYVSFLLGEIHSPEIPFSIRSNLSYGGIGFHLGIQQSLEKYITSKSAFADQLKHIVFDFHLVGAGLDLYTLKFSLHDVDPEVYNQSNYIQLLKMIYDEYPFLPKINYSLLDYTKPVKASLLWPGIKLGFSVGYKF